MPGIEDDLNGVFVDIGDPDYNEEEDTPNVNQFVHTRKVDGPVPVIIQATTTGDMTMITVRRRDYPDKQVSCYVDTPEISVILDSLQAHLNLGRYMEYANFIKELGHVVHDPINFRMQMDATLGTTGCDDDRDNISDMF
jgi:hypothetical protein